VSASAAENCTDLGNARRLVRRHGTRIRYVHPWPRWLVYSGGRWVADDTGELERLAKETALSIYREAIDAERDNERQVLAKWAVKSESQARLHAMIDLASSEPRIPVLPEQLDADLWLLNLQNGTLDLRTGSLRPHAASDLITKLAPVRWDPESQAPTWRGFLERIIPGDPELLGFLQRAIGYSLTGDTGEQVLFFLHGRGCNGKSTLLETYRGLLGDYALQADISTFLERRREGASNDLARLRSARFVAAVEAGEGQRLDEGVVKQLTGGDTVSARMLYSEHFEFRPQFKLWFAANHKPVIRGTDHAIWRRIRLVPFTVTIAEAERDPELPAKLRTELPGILRWAVEGCLAWQRDGLGTPPAVRAATQSYRLEMDVLAAFLEDRCELGAALKAPATALYEAYRSWCERNGERFATQRHFGQALLERDFHRVKSTGGVYAWYGLRLVDPVDEVDRPGGNSPYHFSPSDFPRNGPLGPLGPLGEVPVGTAPMRGDAWDAPSGVSTGPA
jgi:putative DNA primase/helicase